MYATSLLLLFVACFVANRKLSLNFTQGVGWSVFFLVLLPSEMRIEMPGGLPQLTVHRLIVLILAMHAFRQPLFPARPLERPVFTAITLLVIARTLSTVAAARMGPAVKDLLGLVLEEVLFFIALTRSIQSERVVRSAAWGAGVALVFIAILSTIEKYLHVNLAARLVPGMLDFGNTITATFRHRIMFGYSMAMGFPLVLALRHLSQTPWQKRVSTLACALLPAGCYFGYSRGPWAGCGAGATILGVLSGGKMRRLLSGLGGLALVVLILRPGVRDTLVDMWHHTFSTDTAKGQSASYRVQLWRVAIKVTGQDFVRTLIGFGGQSTEYMDFQDEFEIGGGTWELGYTSWDSELAAALVKFGWIGLSAECFLYLMIFVAVLRAWLASSGPQRDLCSAALGGICVYYWALTNVSIFNPQLKFLFLTLVAVGIRCALAPPPAPVEEDETPADLLEPSVGFPRALGPR